MKYSLNSSATGKEISGELSLSEGVTSTCVPENGKYVFTPIGCHGYSETSFKWQSGQGPVTLSAVSHQFTSKIVTDKSVDDLYANVMNSQNRLVKR